MARVLYDGLVEYEDGTPATTSQMAKDVVEFLNWAAEPEMDVRKKMGVSVIVISSALLALSIWVKRCVAFRNCNVSIHLLCWLTINDPGINGRRLRRGKLSITHHPWYDAKCRYKSFKMPSCMVRFSFSPWVFFTLGEWA